MSPSQRDWLELMSEAGYATAVAYGAAEAIELIRRYLRGEMRMSSNG